MIEFNDYHIFAGEIKQILANFCLPKYRDGKWQKTDEPTYFFGEDLKNWTRKLKIRTNAYDSYTHEYLGWYLRFYRDWKKIDLMPLYNCFSDSACSNLELSFTPEILGSAGSVCPIATFDSADSSYKIYSLPIMVGQKYTVAIDSDKPIEICCAIYDVYAADSQKQIPERTYVRKSMTSFNDPFLYDTSDLREKCRSIGEYEADVRMILKIDASVKSSIVILEGDYRGWNDTTMSKYETETRAKNKAFAWETVSNHWVTNYDDADIAIGQSVRYLDPTETAEFDVAVGDEIRTIVAPVQRAEDADTEITRHIAPIEEACANFKPITPLQLLRLNSGVSHPFADRLIEYLTGNAITDDDEIRDDIERVQQTMSFNYVTKSANSRLDNISFSQAGMWDDRIRPMLYDSMQVDRYNGNDRNHDVLGYVDKDVETYYRSVEWKGVWEEDESQLYESKGSKLKESEDWYLRDVTWDPIKGLTRVVHTIASEDIYPDMYRDSK